MKVLASDEYSAVSGLARPGSGLHEQVTGPSLTSSTAICAPNRPPSRAQRIAHALVQRLGLLGRRGSMKLGRLPLRACRRRA